ncbi:MAG: tyrosine-type recombinase/integrase [Acidobacteria bacterium]|nr:tyrosine-type recombinase/integrase [Acidobacteriota bacterium]
MAATERNKTAAQRIEAKARELVLTGRAHELRLEVKPFSEAGAMFLDWAQGEYRQHPATARRLATSFASLREFFGGTAVSAITAGAIEDYKGWRRSAHEVREITLRHDLHALSKFYGYAMRHNWCRRNPLTSGARAEGWGVEIPSDGDAVRMHILTAAEEVLYFACAQALGLTNLHDVGRLMLLQGFRPDEVLALRPQDVDLVRSYATVAKGKTDAAARTLRLAPESARILSRRMVAGAKWIFPSPKKPGQHLTKLNGPHAELIESAGLSFVPYDLRHTFATRAAAAGVPLASLAAILGHGNLRSVHKYIHPTQAHMDSAMDLLSSRSGFGPVEGAEKGDFGGFRKSENDPRRGLQNDDSEGQIQ